MSGLSQSLRLKRFAFKAGSPVEFTVETELGERLKLDLHNCALGGLAAFHGSTEPLSKAMEVGKILPAAKLSWEGHEFTLGRLTVRSVTSLDGKTLIGFSTVDAKIPVESLTAFFTGPLDESKNPHEFELNSDKFSLADFIHSTQTNVDLLGRCQQFSVFFNEWKKSNKYGYHSVRTASFGTRINLTRPRGKGRTRNDYIVMGSNDYLGLSSHPRVIEAARTAISQYGFGATGSPVTTGLTDIHEELTDYLARLLRKPKALLFNSGYAANVGIIAGLTGGQDLVVADQLSHASIQDAMGGAKSTGRFFKHNSAPHLDKVLTENRSNFAGALVVTEGVFSMDGDVAPLDEIIQVARKHNARVMVDEAHSLGVIGRKGLGVVEKYNAFDSADIVMGTFSKICGGIGGFVAASDEVIEWLHAFSRAYIFSVSIPPSTAAAALEALKIFSENPSLLENLRKNISHFVQGIRNLGWSMPADHESSVVPLVIGDQQKLGIMNEIFLEEGVHVTPVVYPAVSRTNCRFRFTITATHTIADLDYVLNVIEKAMLKAKLELPSARNAA